MKQTIYNPNAAAMLALEFFQRGFPMSRDEFKASFRQACKRLHTDVSGADTKDQFIKMKDFYETICSQDPDWAFSGTDGVQRLRTTDGAYLCELGLGLEPTKNGRDCTKCEHKGYSVEEIGGWIRCEWCTSGWAYAQPCNRCNGTGDFKVNGKSKGQCFTCKGSGVHQCKFVVRCAPCKGTGGKVLPTGTRQYHTCWECKGTGEIEIFNPVIPKGRLM